MRSAGVSPATRRRLRARSRRTALGRSAPVRSPRHQPRRAHAAEPPSHSPIAVEVMQSDDGENDENPAGYREESQIKEIRFFFPRLDELAVLRAFTETAQGCAGVKAGSWCGKRLVFVVQDIQFELSGL